MHDETLRERQLEPELMDKTEEAEAYARASFTAVNSAFVARLLELSSRGDEAKVVDLGCGPAEIPVLLAIARPTWRIVAIDGSPAMLSWARQAVAAGKVAERVSLMLGNATATWLASQGYDVVCSNSLLHHLPDPLPLYREMRRLAAPGGLVFLRDLRRPTSARSAAELVDRHAAGESALLREEFFRSLLAAHTVEEVRRQLDDLGLRHWRVEASSDRHLDVIGGAD